MPNKYVVNITKGGIEAKQVYTYEEKNKSTKLVWEVEYKVPIPLLGKLAEAVAAKMNSREVELVLVNLKEKMEA